jgi:hypothetical protein
MEQLEGGFNWCVAAGAAFTVGMIALTGGVAALAFAGSAAIAAGTTATSVALGVAEGGLIATISGGAVGAGACH